MKYNEIINTVNRIIGQYDAPLTVRQIYYRLISPPLQLFENTRSMYNSFDHMLTIAREKGRVDWTRIEDRSRQFLGGDFGFGSIQEFIRHKLQEFAANTFTMPLWAIQPCLPVCWVEKDALSTLFNHVGSRYRVITFPSRGYSSFTKVMETITKIGGNGKRVVILHFADHDPSGINMTEDVKRRLAKYGLANFEVRRIALIYEQVRQYNLAPNPAKKSDPRAKDYIKQYGDRSWELDALDPAILQEIIEHAIIECIDMGSWDACKAEIERKKEEARKKLEELSKLVLSRSDGFD